MQVYKISSDKFRLDLSRNELIAISNCINEAVNGLDIREKFATRVGSDVKSVEEIHDQILAALDSP
jgi:hypothetical protein